MDLTFFFFINLNLFCMHIFIVKKLIILLYSSAVVGEKERNNTTVNVRTRDNKVHGEHAVSHVIERFKHFRDEKTVDAEDKF